MAEPGSRSFEHNKVLLSTIRHGLSDLGFLLGAESPGSLPLDLVNSALSSYSRAIHLLENDFFPEDTVVYQPAGELQAHRFGRGAYDFYGRSTGDKIPAGSSIVYSRMHYGMLRLQIFGETRLRSSRHLPEQVHYLPFDTEDMIQLYISGDDLARDIRQGGHFELTAEPPQWFQDKEAARAERH